MDATSNFSFSFAKGSESLTTVDPSAHDPVPERVHFLQSDISRTISVVYCCERTEDLLGQPALALFRQQWHSIVSSSTTTIFSLRKISSYSWLFFGANLTVATQVPAAEKYVVGECAA